MEDLAGVALAAGAARRLRPISPAVAKPLCPVGATSLLDHALGRLWTVTDSVAVNVHHDADAIGRAVGGRAHVAHERDRPLGTAGAIGNLRDWVDGRAVIVVNADTWAPGSLAELTDGWSGDVVRLLVPGGGPFGPTSAVIGCLLPASVAARLAPEPTGLYEVVWKDAAAAGRLEVIPSSGPWSDCGTPARLLEANLAAIQLAGGAPIVSGDADVDGTVSRSVVGAGATIAGEIVDCVIFPGAIVHRAERLVRTIRLRARHSRPSSGQLTVLVR